MDDLEYGAAARAPDYVEPIEAWRIWLVVRTEQGAALRSVFFKQLWEPGEAAVAFCGASRRHLLPPWRRQPTHAAPEAACDCGIYAARSPLDVAAYVDRDAPFTFCWAIGRVALWGTVVECRYGWRASHAYPRRIVIPTVQGDTRRLRPDPIYHEVVGDLRAYGVPVEVLEGSVDDLRDPLAA